MRLDKFLSDTGTATRSESKKYVRRGLITVNGIKADDVSVHISPEQDVIALNGERIIYKRFIYIMLNKPDGILSATEDRNTPTVIDLLDDRLKGVGLFPCGRLDKDTLGLLILTNNGELAHFLLSPSRHVGKTYNFKCANVLTDSDIETLCKGVDIGEKSSTRPAECQLTSGNEGKITVYEGKYHQIKRMFEAINNKITYLERISFGGIPLDTSLSRGEWRYLTDEETEILENNYIRKA